MHPTPTDATSAAPAATSWEAEEPRNSGVVIVLAVLVWTIAVSGITALIVAPDHVPSAKAWPAQSRLMRSLSTQTLIMRFHPQHAGSRASLNELAAIMRQSNGQVRAYVLFVKPVDKSDLWAKTNDWRAACRIPGVTPIIDEDGVEASAFGAEASGDVCVFDRDGKRIFNGAATATRTEDIDSEHRTIFDVLKDRATLAEAATMAR